MFTLFSGRHTGGLRRSSDLRFHTRLYDFAGNISTNISTLGQRTQLKLGELCSLYLVDNTDHTFLILSTE